MTDKHVLALFSLCLTFVGYGFYIPSVLRQETRPHIFSWVIWGVVVGIAFFAQLSRGAGAGAWTTGCSSFMCLVVAVISLRHGEKSITRSDWIAFVGALAALPVWFMTKDALWAVVIVTMIDMMAYYPTLRKVYHKPFEENFVIFITDAIKWIPALFALDHISVATTFFQCFVIVENSTVAATILWRRHQIRKTKK